MDKKKPVKLVWKPKRAPRQRDAVLSNALDSVSKVMGENDALKEKILEIKTHDDEEEVEPEAVMSLPDVIPLYRKVGTLDRIETLLKCGVLAWAAFRSRLLQALLVAGSAAYAVYRLSRAFGVSCLPNWVSVLRNVQDPVSMTVDQANSSQLSQVPYSFCFTAALSRILRAPFWNACLRWGTLTKVLSCQHQGADARLHTSMSSKLRTTRVEVAGYELIDDDSITRRRILATEQQVSQLRSACVDVSDEVLAPRVAKSVTSTNIPSSLSSHTIVGSRVIALSTLVSDRLRMNLSDPNLIRPAWSTVALVTVLMTSALLYVGRTSLTQCVSMVSERLGVG